IRTEEPRCRATAEFVALLIKENYAEKLIALELMKVVVQGGRAAAQVRLRRGPGHRLHRRVGGLEAHNQERRDRRQGDEHRHRAPEGEEYFEKQAPHLLPVRSAATTGLA